MTRRRPAVSPDPDDGRRVLQCRCGATRRHTTVHDAFVAHWRTRWEREVRIWHCPVCYWAPPYDAPPRSTFCPVRVAELANGRTTDDRIGALFVVDRLRETDPECARLWFFQIVCQLTRRAAIEQWAEWAHFRGLYGEPMLAQHSSQSNEHFTPPEICDRGRVVFGGEIDCDPASCAEANKLVRATTYYTREDDGLLLPWRGTVFLNPPGGTIKAPSGEKVSCAAYWWAMLASRYQSGEVTQAFFLAFNLEVLRHTQAWPTAQPLDFAACVFRHRLRYYSARCRSDSTPRLGRSPTHPSALIYLGPHIERFKTIFGADDAFGGYVHLPRVPVSHLALSDSAGSPVD